jgi:hypothetical protein
MTGGMLSHNDLKVRAYIIGEDKKAHAQTYIDFLVVFIYRAFHGRSMPLYVALI